MHGGGGWKSRQQATDLLRRLLVLIAHGIQASIGTVALLMVAWGRNFALGREGDAGHGGGAPKSGTDLVVPQPMLRGRSVRVIVLHGDETGTRPLSEPSLTAFLNSNEE